MKGIRVVGGARTKEQGSPFFILLINRITKLLIANTLIKKGSGTHETVFIRRGQGARRVLLNACRDIALICSPS